MRMLASKTRIASCGLPLMPNPFQLRYDLLLIGIGESGTKTVCCIAQFGTFDLPGFPWFEDVNP
jgi:hypothetical protein